jgi:hypothetical protein
MRTFPPHPDWSRVLVSVLETAQALGATAVLAFDLDSTLFDNRPRQARILREFGQEKGISPLTRCTPEDFVSGWDMRGPMRRLGMAEADVELVYPELKAFWQARFFTSEYCEDDVAIPGAAGFCLAVTRTSAQLCYVTGRHEGMRPGTEAALRKGGLPLPGGNVSLLMKPTLSDDDDAFKRVAHAALEQKGTLVAAFDNEPTHANDYRRRFPGATVIHLGTDHSGRPVELLPGIVTVPHFDHAQGA